MDMASDRTQLLDEDFQENEDIPLPVEENSKLTEKIRKMFQEGKDFSVVILDIFGRQAIVGIDEDEDK